MGGCGTYSVGKTPEKFLYESHKELYGVKIIEPVKKSDSWKLPEESAKSRAYLLLDKYGIFRQYREYDKNHQVILEIGYHREKKVGKGRVLHIHRFKIPGVENHPDAEPLTPDEIQKYKKFFVGVPGYDK